MYADLPADQEQWDNLPAGDFVIRDWAGNLVNTGGRTFATFEDGWSWIHAHIPDVDRAYEDLFVEWSGPEESHGA